MKPPFLKSLRLDGFLSFAPGSEAIELRGLNVLIGPNGSGKSNVIEAVELLKALPVDFAAAVRVGGGAEGFLWKGGKESGAVEIEADLVNQIIHERSSIYYLKFEASNQSVEIQDEYLNSTIDNSEEYNRFFFRRVPSEKNDEATKFSTDGLVNGLSTNEIHVSKPNQSMFIWNSFGPIAANMVFTGYSLKGIQTFREWTFGRSSSLRRAQPTDMPDDFLLPDNSNLALIINKIENEGDWPRFNALLKRFFPRFERITTRTAGNTIQFYLWETGFSSPISPTRMSDGTLRFIAILATLLTPEPPPLICIEEPELGMHPDAMAIMADLLVEASERMQIIVTTHSDALVSGLSAHPEAILTCENNGDGTKLRRLDPEKLKHWMDKYLLGDLWRMGELGANP